MAGAGVGTEGSRSASAGVVRGRAMGERRRGGRLWARLRHDPVAAASAVFLVLVTLAAVLAPALAPGQPAKLLVAAAVGPTPLPSLPHRGLVGPDQGMLGSNRPPDPRYELERGEFQTI